MLTLCTLVSFFAIGAPDVAIVSLDPAPEVHDATNALAARWTAAGDRVLTPAEISERLTGTNAPAQPDAQALRAKLEEARLLEANFATVEANSLRKQILETFGNSPRPSQAVRVVAAEACYDMAAAMLADFGETPADTLAQACLRRFGDITPDKTRIPPPAMAFFDEQRRALAAGPQADVVVRTTVAGDVVAEGRKLGSAGDGQLEIRLPTGEYRLWVTQGDRMSLPYAVKLVGPRIEVVIDPDLDARLALGTRLALTCADYCADSLRRLGRRLGVQRAVGIRRTFGPHGRPAFALLQVDVPTGAATRVTVDPTGEQLGGEEVVAATAAPAGGPRPSPAAPPQTDAIETASIDQPVAAGAHREPAEEVTAEAAVPRQTMPAFTPGYLIPFGGGQFVQERTAFGVAYLAADLGLLGWAVSAEVMRGSANEKGNLLRGEELRQQRNLAVILFGGMLVAQVAEALIVGAVLGE